MEDLTVTEEELPPRPATVRIESLSFTNLSRVLFFTIESSFERRRRRNDDEQDADFPSPFSFVESDCGGQGHIAAACTSPQAGGGGGFQGGAPRACYGCGASLLSPSSRSFFDASKKRRLELTSFVLARCSLQVRPDTSPEIVLLPRRRLATRVELTTVSSSSSSLPKPPVRTLELTPSLSFS